MAAWLQKRKVLIAFVLLAPLLVYSNSLDGPFHYDDSHSIVDNPHIRSLANIPAFFSDPTLFSANPDNAMYRPLLLASFALNYALSGYEVWSYHLLSLALHLGCAYLVLLSGEILLQSRPAALLAALVFGVHPINTEPLNYISSRSEIMAGFFVLLAFWAFLRGCSGRVGKGLVAGGYAAALLAKSVAILLPAILLVYQLVVRRRSFSLKLYGVLGLIGAGYVALVWRFLHKASIGAPVRSYEEQLWSQVKALVLYLKLLVWPQGQNVDHQFLLSSSLVAPFDLAACSAFLLVGSLLWLAFYHRRRHPLLLFLLLFALLALAPSTLVPLNVLVNEHRLYLSSAAFALALAYGALQVARRGRVWQRGIAVLALVVVLLCSGLSMARNQLWGSDLTLWRDAAAKAPLMARPHYYLGEALAVRGQVGAAILAFERALQRDPAFTAVHARLGQLYLENGQTGSAERILQQGLEVDPEDRALWRGLAACYRARGGAAAQNNRKWMEKSLEAYRRALVLAPPDAALHNNLGNTLQALGRVEEGLRHHRLARDLAPGDARTQVNIGAALWALNDLEGAQRAFARAVGLDSLFAMAWYNLGQVRQKRGQKAAAREAFKKAAGLDRAYAELLGQRLRSGEEVADE